MVFTAGSAQIATQGTDGEGYVVTFGDVDMQGVLCFLSVRERVQFTSELKNAFYCITSFSLLMAKICVWVPMIEGKK